MVVRSIPCLEKVLYLGKPQDRTFRYPLSPIPNTQTPIPKNTTKFVLMQDVSILHRLRLLLAMSRVNYPPSTGVPDGVGIPVCPAKKLTD